MRISLLHPSRGRPSKSSHTIAKWLSKAGRGPEIELIVSLDEDDSRLKDYHKYYPGAIINKNRSAVDAVNQAAKLATGDIMIVLSDDFECPQGWAVTIENAIRGANDFVLKINDGTQRYIVTMPILDRAYYNRFGYVYHPEYKHMFVDTDFTHVADCLKKIIWRNDILFKHSHYSVMRSRPDEINRRADATWEQGKKLYIQRVKNKFGLGLNVWDIDRNGADHVKWLKHNLRSV